MGINVRNAKLTASTSEALTSLSKKRTVILTDRKQTALDTDTVNEKLTSTIVEYIKETNVGNEFNCLIDIEDKRSVFKLTLANGVHLTKSVQSNLFALKPEVMIAKIDESIDYLKELRSSMAPFPAITKAKFNLDTGDENKFPLVILNIKTRTKYF